MTDRRQWTKASSSRLPPITLPERVREVAAKLLARRIRIDIRCGGELAQEMVPRLLQRELETIAHGPAGRQWLLLEAPLDGIDPAYTEAADELRDRGFAVVVAHPERALRWSDAGWETLEHELAAGSVVQINAWSVAGLYGEMVRATALWLLRTAPQAVVASARRVADAGARPRARRAYRRARPGSRAADRRGSTRVARARPGRGVELARGLTATAGERCAGAGCGR